MQLRELVERLLGAQGEDRAPGGVDEHAADQAGHDAQVTTIPCTGSLEQLSVPLGQVKCAAMQAQVYSQRHAAGVAVVMQFSAGVA